MVTWVKRLKAKEVPPGLQSHHVVEVALVVREAELAEEEVVVQLLLDVVVVEALLVLPLLPPPSLLDREVDLLLPLPLPPLLLNREVRRVRSAKTVKLL